MSTQETRPDAVEAAKKFSALLKSTVTLGAKGYAEKLDLCEAHLDALLAHIEAQGEEKAKADALDWLEDIGRLNPDGQYGQVEIRADMPQEGVEDNPWRHRWTIHVVEDQLPLLGAGETLFKAVQQGMEEERAYYAQHGFDIDETREQFRLVRAGNYKTSEEFFGALRAAIHNAREDER